MVTLTPQEARERVRAGDRLCSSGPTGVTVVDHLVGTGVDAVPVRQYLAAQDRGVTLVYAHGGGWVTGDLDYSDELCRFVASIAGCTVISVDYRLAPEHPFPAGLRDVEAAVRWAADQPWTEVLAIAGDSAGGNLAAAATQKLLFDGGPAPAFQVLAYPVLDSDFETPSYKESAAAFPIGIADMRWFFDHYVAEDLRTDAAVSPLRSPIHEKTPRTHVVTAGHDPLRSEGEAWAAASAAAGVPTSHLAYENLCHGFLRFTASSAAAREARGELVDTIRRLAGEAVSTSRGDLPKTVANHPYHQHVGQLGDTIMNDHVSGEHR